MSSFFYAATFVLGVITWAMTTYLAFLNWGFIGALSSFFIPPLDLIYMFMLGTWPIGLAALICFGLHIATDKQR